MTATKTKKPEVKNLKKLDIGNEKIIALMLPSDAKSIIVKHSNSSSVRVTCSFSAKSRAIDVRSCYDARQGNKTKIRTPPTLMSVKYYDIPTATRMECEQFSILGFDIREKNEVWAAPYILSNVYRSGKICFGSHYPKDLRAAYNLFWTAPFNRELLGEGVEVAGSLGERDSYYGGITSFVKKYNKKVFALQDWEDYTDKICGNKYWASSTATDAVLVTNNKKLLKKIPKNYWRKHGKTPIFIGRAKKTAKTWNFDSGTLKFQLPLKNVVTRTQRSLEKIQNRLS